MSDFISREEVLRAIITCDTAGTDLTHLYKVIENLPSAEPKIAKWVLHDGYYCTRCGYKLVTTAIPNRCPSCFADMIGVEA